MHAITRLSLAHLMTLLVMTSAREVHCSTKDGYTFPEGVILKDGEEFEYIVVGAGASGAAVASRLALAGADVLLVEAGGNPTEISKIPVLAPALAGSSLDYQYETISNNESCLSFPSKACRFSRGKCLGGSTSINAMIYVRGCHPDDFDDFNIKGWSWIDMSPYFLRYEGLQGLDLLPPSSVPFHNTTGNMKMEFFSDSGNVWDYKFIEGMMSLGFPFNPDVNARSQIGVSPILGFVFDGERMSTARGYLARDDVKGTLKVAKHTKCTGIIIDDENVARGIIVVVGYGLFQSELRLYVTKEVILSAGAIATSQILMLSGIGPAEHLRDMNVPVRVDLSVGDDMYDHFGPVLCLKIDDNTRDLKEWLSIATNADENYVELHKFQTSSLTSIGVPNITAFLNSQCYDFHKRQLTNNSATCRVPTLQYHVYQYLDRHLLTIAGPLIKHAANFGDAVFKQLSAVNINYAILVILPVVLYPKSKGTVRLAAPAIFPNFCSDEQDLEEMVRSIHIMEHLIQTPLFKSQNASVLHLELPGCPDHDTDSEGYWRCYARHMTQSIFHAAGTTALGRVVDERLRVRGVQRLRVADLGVLPRPTRSNTAAVAIAIGERAADFIMEDSESF